MQFVYVIAVLSTHTHPANAARNTYLIVYTWSFLQITHAKYIGIFYTLSNKPFSTTMIVVLQHLSTTIALLPQGIRILYNGLPRKFIHN